jgi:dienelactone hydrolase
MALVTWATAARAPAGQSGPPFYADKTNLLVYIDAAGQPRRITTPEDWPERRAHILASMQLVMGPFPNASRRVPLDVQELEEADFPKFKRRKITFAVEKGDRLPAYVLIPRKLESKAPAVLCLHPTSPLGKGVPVGMGPKPNRSYALELAQRGYVALAPDYPNMGDYRLDPYARGYASATMKGIWNHARAIDLLQSLPQVDPDRIGCIGHSLGGHNTMFLAAFDTRIKATVSSCGFNSFPKYYRGNLTGWSHRGYMPRIATVYGKDPRKMPFDFTEVVAALAPRPFFVNAPVGDSNFEVSGVRDCIAAAKPVYELLGERENLVAVYPDAGHDFPPQARQAAYAFLDRVLAKR